MRVIAGQYRGLKLFSPKDQFVRPTTDRIKEDIFNIISPYIPDGVFLDLFSGSGQIAIEAVSRGAARAVMVENSPSSIELIRKNLALLKGSKPELVKSSAEKFLIETRNEYDIIFMDPPYKNTELTRLTDAIVNRRLVKDDGVIIIEHSSETLLPEALGEFEVFKTKLYSGTKVNFYRKNTTEE